MKVRAGDAADIQECGEIFRLVSRIVLYNDRLLRIMKLNKKYQTLAQQKCKPYYESDDYQVLVFKIGRRRVPVFYVPLYGSGHKKI